MTTDSMGSWVCVYEGTEMTAVTVDDEPRIDAAVSRHIESGGTMDTLLDLTTLNGSQFRVRASRITSWMVSTPETRKRNTELCKLQNDETAEHKAALGIWDEDA